MFFAPTAVLGHRRVWAANEPATILPSSITTTSRNSISESLSSTSADRIVPDSLPSNATNSTLNDAPTPTVALIGSSNATVSTINDAPTPSQELIDFGHSTIADENSTIFGNSTH